MLEIINNKQLSINNRKGAVLLVVLFIVMAISVLALGFMSRSNIELACGRNMILRTQMDAMSESALDHAKGLIINPQDISTQYWTGSSSQQLDAGSNDYYDIQISRDDSDPADRCNYTIECDSYRMVDGQKIGCGGLSADIRIDPAICYWINSGATITEQVTVNGDVYCTDGLWNAGTINGDVFANGAISGTSILGRQNESVTQPPVAWPGIQANDFYSQYYINTSSYSALYVSYEHPSGSFGPTVGNPAGIRYRSSLRLDGDIDIEGTLVVTGDLIVRGSNNRITATKNFPALIVGGDLKIYSGSLEINGLAIVQGEVLIKSDDVSLNVVGAMCVGDGIIELAEDSSGNFNIGKLRYSPTWRPSGGQRQGAIEFNGTNEYVEIKDEDDYDIFEKITVAAWIKVNAFNLGYQAIVTKGDSAWRIQRYSNSNNIEFACTGLTHNSYGNISGSINVNNGQWHHVAGVYDGSRIYLYVDGALDVSVPTSGIINRNNYNVMIGENAQARGRYWNGLIDDVQVYADDLSQEQINTIKTGGSIGGVNLLGHWRFDEQGANITITADPAIAAIQVWPEPGNPERWTPAAGAFFRSIQRR